MRISDWSSDVCSSDLNAGFLVKALRHPRFLSGDVATGFIAATLESLVPEPSPNEGMWKLAALSLGWMFDEANRILADTPWRDLGGCGPTGARRATVTNETNGATRVIDGGGGEAERREVVEG